MCGRGIGNLLFPLVATGVLTNETTQPAAVVTSQATCPNCESKVLSSFDWCPQCGTGLKPHGFAHRAARQQEAEENHEWFQYAKI